MCDFIVGEFSVSATRVAGMSWDTLTFICDVTNFRTLAYLFFQILIKSCWKFLGAHKIVYRMVPIQAYWHVNVYIIDAPLTMMILVVHQVDVQVDIDRNSRRREKNSFQVMLTMRLVSSYLLNNLN